MFDSNATGIPCGEFFFAEIHSVSSELEKKGIVVGATVVCEHIQKSGNRVNRETTTLVWLTSKTEPIKVVDRKDRFDDCFFVYSGNLDGTGFLSCALEEKAFALAFLGGLWCDNENQKQHFLTSTRKNITL